MHSDLTHRTALVTGAARGIGLAAAKALAAGGANVALVDLDAKALHAALGSFSKSSTSAMLLPLAADVARRDDVTAAIAALKTPEQPSQADQAKTAAKQLEAFFLRQLLTEARPQGGGIEPGSL